MQKLLPVVYNETVHLLEETFRKNSHVTEEEFNDIFDNFINLFKIVNLSLVPEDLPENIRQAKIISMNEDMIRLFTIYKIKIKNNKQDYIVDFPENESESKDANQNAKGTEMKPLLGDNESDEILRDETVTAQFNSIEESKINFLINESSIYEKQSSFNELSIINETNFKILKFDTTKDTKYYRTNYIFKSLDGNLVYKIYEDLKTDESLKKAIMIQIQIGENKKIYYLMFLSNKAFRIKKYMRYYLTSELDSMSIDARFELIEKRGEILFREINDQSKKTNENYLI